jgi:hypothetical protein
MTDLKLLVGSLSNDLFRVASLKQRGAEASANRFLLEAKRWSSQLEGIAEEKYIRDIARAVNETSPQDLGLEKAEKFLMYGTLLQNYSLHCN